MSADCRGLVSQAGTVLLWETPRVIGLARGLSAALEPWRAPRAVHDPGKIVADLAAVLALARVAAPGGDGGPVIIDLDATIVIAHSQKRHARVPDLADREVPAAGLLRRHDDHRARRRGDREGSRGCADAGL